MSARFRVALLIIITLLTPMVPFAVIGELPGERWLSASDQQAWRFALTGAGLLAIDVLLPVPSSLVGTLLGARLGFMAGGFWAWSGLLAGNAIGYGVGRLLLARLAVPLPQTPAWLVIFVSRPVPVLAEAAAIGAGAGRLPFLPFMGVCAAGNGIYALVLAGNGATLLPHALAGPGLILPLSLPVVGWLLWRWLARRKNHLPG